MLPVFLVLLDFGVQTAAPLDFLTLALVGTIVSKEVEVKAKRIRDVNTKAIRTEMPK